MASPDGRDNSLTIQQDACVYLGSLGAGDSIEHRIGVGRHAWLQVLRGETKLGETTLLPGDGVAISDEPALAIAATWPCEVMVFDLS